MAKSNQVRIVELEEEVVLLRGILQLVLEELSGTPTFRSGRRRRFLKILSGASVPGDKKS